jgi:hypothetical protein
MKYLFSILILFLFSFSAISQGSKVITKENYNKWHTCQETGNGKASFFVTISTNWKKYDGFYYFDIYYYNNSFDRDGNELPTYIKDICYYVWERGVDGKYAWRKVYYQRYLLIKPREVDGKEIIYDGIYHDIYIYHTIPVGKIKITWGETTFL